MAEAEESPLQSTVRERLTSFLRGRGIRVEVSSAADGGSGELAVSIHFTLGGRPHDVVIHEDDVELTIGGKAAGSFAGADYDDESAVARDVLKQLDRELTSQKT